MYDAYMRYLNNNLPAPQLHFLALCVWNKAKERGEAVSLQFGNREKF